eukprot:3506769-Prymnesium_polylepis.1
MIARSSSQPRCGQLTPSQFATGSGCIPRARKMVIVESVDRSMTQPRKVVTWNVGAPSFIARLAVATDAAYSTPDAPTIQRPAVRRQ